MLHLDLTAFLCLSSVAIALPYNHNYDIASSTSSAAPRTSTCYPTAATVVDQRTSDLQATLLTTLVHPPRSSASNVALPVPPDTLGERDDLHGPYNPSNSVLVQSKPSPSSFHSQHPNASSSIDNSSSGDGIEGEQWPWWITPASWALVSYDVVTLFALWWIWVCGYIEGFRFNSSRRRVPSSAGRSWTGWQGRQGVRGNHSMSDGGIEMVPIAVTTHHVGADQILWTDWAEMQTRRDAALTREMRRMGMI